MAVTTPNGLPGIPVSSGGNYTDESGQQWLCDEIDFARGVHVQRVALRVFNGSENWILNPSANGKYRVYVEVNDLLSPPSSADMPIILCSAFEAKSANATYLNNEGISLATGDTGSMYVYSSSHQDLATWKSYLSSNPMTVIAVLAAPVETFLSTDDLSAFRAMTSQKPTTTVYNDAEAGMAVDYIADTKNYIDQRIAALLNA